MVLSKNYNLSLNVFFFIHNRNFMKQKNYDIEFKTQQR